MNRAFTLIEMMVAVGVFTIVTIVVLLRFDTFTNSVVVTSEAYGIALNIRQAQSYGINVRGTAYNDFTRPFGVYINKGGNDRLYILYEDIRLGTSGTYSYNEETKEIEVDGYTSASPNNPCGTAGNEECVEKRITRNQTRVYDICIKEMGSNTTTCGIDIINIMFVRPSPRAIMFETDAGTLLQEVQVIVASTDPDKGRARITITWTGQISVIYEKD